MPVIAHQLTRVRLKAPEPLAELRREFRADEPADFAGSQVIPPDLTFWDRLNIDAGGPPIQELHHLPGHSADSVVVHVPNWGSCWPAMRWRPPCRP